MLELQRFQTLLKLHPIELHATFLKPGPATAHGHCSLALWTLGGAACVAVILGRSATRCYKRRQSEQLFVRSPEWLLQTSSIRRLFR